MQITNPDVFAIMLAFKIPFKKPLLLAIYPYNVKTKLSTYLKHKQQQKKTKIFPSALFSNIFHVVQCYIKIKWFLRCGNKVLLKLFQNMLDIVQILILWINVTKALISMPTA